MEQSRLHAFTDDDALGRGDATEVAERISRGEISPTEALEAALARLDSVDEVLGGLRFEDFDRARHRATVAAPRGAFGGVPSAIKDNVTFSGMAVTMGSEALPTSPQGSHGPFVRQFLDTGLNPIGTTTCPPFGWTATTERVHGDVTRNPWHTAYSSGGSSGGSASLVAAGVLPIAHANDGGGSIRIPAAACGLVGLKASRGRMLGDPTTAHMPVDIVCNGVVARSVRDVARFFEAAERTHKNPAMPSIAGVDGAPARRLRIGMILDSPFAPATDVATRTAVEEAARQLEALGHEVEPYEPAVSKHFASDFVDYWSMIAWAIVANGKREFGPDFDKARLDPLTLGLAKRYSRRLHRTPLVVGRLRDSARLYEKRFGDVDLVMSPVLTHTTPEIGYLSADLTSEEHMSRLVPYASFTPLHNACGAPAISLPLGQTDDGRPIGVMLSARTGQDRRLLEIAFELEAAQPLGRFARVDD
jgi:amidase